MRYPTTPIQPLPPKFFTSTLIAFLRFLLLHPLYVCLSLILHFGLLSAFRTFASTALLEVATPIVVMLVELSNILFLAPFAFLLQTQKSTETASSAQVVGAAVSSFVRNEAWTSGSVLGWKLWLFALGVGSLTGAFFFSASDSGSPTEPTGIFWVMQTSGLAALLLPLHLTVGLGSFLIAHKQYMDHFVFRPHKAPQVCLHYFLTAVLLNTASSQSTAADVQQQNTPSRLLGLFFGWWILRIFLAPIGLGILFDAFSFAALLHASLGGTLNPKTVTENVPAQMQPTT